MSIENPASPFSTDFEKSVEFFAVLPGNSLSKGAFGSFFPGFIHRVLKVCGWFVILSEGRSPKSKDLRTE